MFDLVNELKRIDCLYCVIVHYSQEKQKLRLVARQAIQRKEAQARIELKQAEAAQMGASLPNDMSVCVRSHAHMHACTRTRA